VYSFQMQYLGWGGGDKKKVEESKPLEILLVERESFPRRRRGADFRGKKRDLTKRKGERKKW